METDKRFRVAAGGEILSSRLTNAASRILFPNTPVMGIFHVKSKTKASTSHRVEVADDGTAVECSCLGFLYNRDCRHVTEIEEFMETYAELRAGRGTVGKQPVIGMREKGGKSVAFPIPDTKAGTLKKAIADHVEPGSEIHTDEHSGYANLPDYIRRHIKHGAGEYVGAGDVTVNAVESMWAVLKRGIYGIWHQVSVKHLRRYVDEATFRLNDANVRVHTLSRLEAFVALAFRCRITYKKFIE